MTVEDKTHDDEEDGHEACPVCGGRQAEDIIKVLGDIIEKHGHAVLSAEEGEWYVTYTVGLSDHGRPEIICFGLPGQLSHIFLNRAVDLLKSGKLVEGEKTDGFIFCHPVVFKRVPLCVTGDYAEVANEWAKKKPIELLQLVWPDRGGAFPWDKSFDQELMELQPLLDKGMLQ